MDKKYILKKNYEFDEVIKKGKKISCDYFVIFFLNDSSLTDFQIGISVGKKFGNAPIRNREKRRVRHMIRENIKLFKSNKKYVIMAKKSEATFEEKKSSLVSMLERIK